MTVLGSKHLLVTRVDVSQLKLYETLVCPPPPNVFPWTWEYCLLWMLSDVMCCLPGGLFARDAVLCRGSIEFEGGQTFQPVRCVDYNVQCGQ